eukprot:Nitzschia sp. Nitz4//scaffold13_size275219//224463//225485//NITZ4_000911-RA/size275219-processed-gene-0.108-mRNA-1//1//CDS//3329536125//1977//frame0
MTERRKPLGAAAAWTTTWEDPLENVEEGADKMSALDVVIPPSVPLLLVDEDDSDDASNSSDEVVGLVEEEDEVVTGPSRLARLRRPELDVDKYMERRQMSPLQERFNAITVIPGAFYCFLFLLSGSWLDDSMVQQAEPPLSDDQCLSFAWLPKLHALPPLPVAAVAFGIIAHAPFSFIYHWSYAHRLPAGFARTNHWSRRMDQAMIHFCSAAMAYGTSGRLDFFFANALFNADCMYRQFKRKVRPRLNQMRIAISVVAYTIPIARRGEWQVFLLAWFILGVSFGLFSCYPVGGWSHSLFHLVIALLPPVLMGVANHLPASQPALEHAAQCAVLAESTASF